MVLKPIESLGAAALNVVEELGRLGVFATRIVGFALRPPYRPRLFVKETYKLGVLSLTIIGISGLAVGMALSLQGYNTLTRFGAADSALGAVVGLGLIRELGPVLTGLLVTGRAGSATTAEIGTMVATEQLDGLRMMSVNPVDLVVVPRAVAMVLVLPLLTAIFIALGILGGYVVGVSLMGLDPGRYMGSLNSAVTFGDDVLGGLIKAVVFGAILGLISTYRGCTSAPTSAGVSQATTSSVVVASVTILISNYFITALWEF